MTPVPAARQDGRRERSRATRARVVAAAYRQFCRSGLSASMTDVAADAGVSVQTLYFSFGTKTALLGEVLRFAVHGDDRPEPPHQRAWFAAMVAEPDPVRALHLLLDGTQGIYDRLGPLVSVFRSGDPEVAAMWRHSEKLRYDGMRLVAKELLRKGEARSGVDLKTATDVVYVLLSADTHHSFAALKWTPAQWQTWAADTVARALFADIPATHRPAAGPRPRARSGKSPTRP